jgi:hypothetical protein
VTREAESSEEEEPDTEHKEIRREEEEHEDERISEPNEAKLLKRIGRAAILVPDIESEIEEAKEAEADNLR